MLRVLLERGRASSGIRLYRWGGKVWNWNATEKKASKFRAEEQIREMYKLGIWTVQRYGYV